MTSTLSGFSIQIRWLKWHAQEVPLTPRVFDSLSLTVGELPGRVLPIGYFGCRFCHWRIWIQSQCVHVIHEGLAIFAHLRKRLQCSQAEERVLVIEEACDGAGITLARLAHLCESTSCCTLDAVQRVVEQVSH